MLEQLSLVGLEEEDGEWLVTLEVPTPVKRTIHLAGKVKDGDTRCTVQYSSLCRDGLVPEGMREDAMQSRLVGDMVLT